MSLDVEYGSKDLSRNKSVMMRSQGNAFATINNDV